MNIDEYKTLASEASVVTTQAEGVVAQEDQSHQTAHAAPDTIEIDGEQVTLDELRKGYLRQGDYTRKTQSLAQQRKDAEEAVKMYEHINKNPDLAKLLRDVDAGKHDTIRNTDPLVKQERMIRELQEQIALDREIGRLSKKFKDFDEIEVLNEAAQRNTTDLEAVYAALKANKPTGIDEATMRAQIRAELEAELRNDVGTTIISGRGVAPKMQEKATLTESEAKIARAFGMKPDDYIKFRQKK